MMGGRLCTQVVDLASLGHLVNQSDRALAVLFVMASVARDSATRKVDAGVYYAGWELLARVLGFKVYNPAAERAVARAIRELTDAGLVVREGRPGPRQRQVYRLALPSPFVNYSQ